MANEIKKPWSIQIELSFGCNNKCDFCYKQVVEKNDYDFMSLNTAKQVVNSIKGFDPVRIELAMRGEPLLNPNWKHIVSMIRGAMPKSQIMLTTNGKLLTDEKIASYYRAGGNILLVDCYGEGKLQERLIKFSKWNPIDFYRTKESPYHRGKPSVKKLFLMDDIANRNKESITRKLCNMAGNVTEKAIEKYGLKTPDKPLNKKCVRPFREMIIFYNGRVGFCCLDGGGQYAITHVLSGDLKEYWKHNPVLNKIRRNLLKKDRNMPLCRTCDYFGGMRQGFLPKKV